MPLSKVLLLAIASTFQLAGTAMGQEKIFASFVLTRTGERTPLFKPWGDIVQLTTSGANDMYNVGSDLRNRYLPTYASSSTAIDGLSRDIIIPSQIAILSSDRQYTTASAQAFLQGFYPPNLTNDTAFANLDVVANGSTIFSPLDGYQYAWIHAASSDEPDSIYVSAATKCKSWKDNAYAWSISDDFNSTQEATKNLYAIAANVLGNEEVTINDYDYSNAYYLSDYLSYMNAHNSSYHNLLTDSNPSNQLLPQLNALASQAEWAKYGSGYTKGNQTIALVAGQSLASIMSETLLENVNTEGAKSKLTLLFTDYSAFLSFSALTKLSENSPADNVDFTAIPNFGSQLLLELFAEGTLDSNDSAAAYPNADNLRVRLLFRNSTDISVPLDTYRLFGSGDSSMAWNDFKTQLHGVSLQGTTQSDTNDDALSAWCANCESWTSTSFCLSTNKAAISVALGELDDVCHDIAGRGISTTMAGAIGAVAALCLMGLILFLGVGCLGWRVTRKPNGRQGPSDGYSSGGGFRHGMKLESDVDLPSGATVEDKSARVTSWELGPGSKKPTASNDIWSSRNREDDELSERLNPFSDPVRPRNHI